MNESRLSQLEFLFFVPAVDAGGISAHTKKWAVELHQRGRQVRVICYRDIRTPYSTKVNAERFQPVPTTTVEFDSLDKESVVARRIAEQISPDSNAVVFSPWMPKMSAIVREMRRSGNTVWHIEQAVGNDDNGFRTLAQNWSTCDGIVAFGSRVANRIKEHPLNQSRPVHTFESLPGSSLPVDLDNGNVNSFTPIRICYLGRLEPIQKRVFDLVEIVQALLEKNVRFQLTIIGGGASQMDLKQRIEDLGAASSIRMHGVLPHAEAMSVLARQHVFVLPSASEGFPGALCEAMCRGVVPVSTKVGGAEDVVGDGVNGYLVDIGDTDAMADHIAEIAADFSKWQALSLQARKTAEMELSIAAAVDKLESGIEDIVSRGPDKQVHSTGHYSTLLEHPFIPNVATRALRTLWRACRPRPTDLRNSKSV